MVERDGTLDALRGELLELRARLAALQQKEVQCLEMEEELRALRRAAENMQLGITITDMEGKIVYTNPAEALMHGYTREELLHQEGRIFAPSNTWKTMLLEEMRQIKRYSRESVNRRKDGSLFPVRLLSDLVTDAGDEPFGVVTTCEDISERHRLEEELRRVNGELERKVAERTATLATTIQELEDEIAERKRVEQDRERVQAQLLHTQKIEAVGQLSAGVAHDFNNILSTILLSTGSGMVKLGPADPLYHDLKRIEAAATRGGKLTQQLLLFSRKAPVDFVSLDLNRTVVEMMKMLRRLLGEDIAVETLLAPDLWQIRADEGNLEQVLLNLAVNARDAMPQGGTLKITTRNVMFDREEVAGHPEARSGKFVCLSVRDDGCGIDGRTLPRIFEPFFTTKGIGSGTGLGLSVVYGIISQHRGWIHVESSPGEGAVFTVYLPADAGAPAAVLPREQAQQRRGRGEQILVVEDDADVRELTATVLRENGYQVREAECAAGAVEIFAREHFHLLLSDVVLPDQSGIRLADLLCEQRPDLLVLLMSGYTDNKSQLPLIRQRGYDFLKKPFAIAALLEEVHELVVRLPRK